MEIYVRDMLRFILRLCGHQAGVKGDRATKILVIVISKPTDHPLTENVAPQRTMNNKRGL